MMVKNSNKEIAMAHFAMGYSQRERWPLQNHHKAVPNQRGVGGRGGATRHFCGWAGAARVPCAMGQ